MPSYTGYQGYGSPERAKVDRARQMAELLQQGATDTGPKSFWEGAAQLGKAFIARGAMDKADQAETAYGDNQKRIADTLISQMYPDAQGVAQQDLAAPAAFDLTPGGMEARQAQGGQGDKVRNLASLLGGDVMGAIEMTEKMKPAGPDYQFMQGPDGSVARGDRTSGGFAVLQPGMPKPADPVKMEQYTDGTGQVWDRNPYTGESKKANVPRARVPGSEGGGSGAPPSGYRWNADGSLSKIPGGPADKPEPGLYTPTEEKNYRGKAQALGTLKFLTNEYRSLVNQYGPGLFDASLKDGEWQKTPEGQKLLSSHNNLMMFLKGPELFNLGVLTGPDVERLQRTLPEPVGMGAFGQSKETLGIGLDSLDQLVGYQMTMIPEEMRAVQGGGGDAVAKPAAPAPMSFMNRQMQGVQAALAPESDDVSDLLEKYRQ
jgi:hypothetical protein